MLAFALIFALFSPLPFAHAANPTSDEIGQTRSFWVWDLNAMPPAHRNTQATLRQVGPRSLVYVEDKLWQSSITPEFLARLGDSLEKSTPQGSFASDKGIIEIEETLFGPLPKKWADDRVIVLFADLGKYKNYEFDGFFNGFDQMKEAEALAQGQHSNEANIIYLNGLRLSEEYTTGVVAHELQHLISHQFTGPEGHDLWLGETLGEVAMLATGFYTDQPHADRFAQAPQNFPLVSHNYVQYGPQLLFASYLLDFMATKKTGLNFLTRTKGNGRVAIEEYLRKNSTRPISFDLLFSNFIGYVFENGGNTLPYTLVKFGSNGLTMPEISPYATLKSFPASLEGSIMPYSYLAIDLPSALPLTSVVQVDTIRVGAKPGSCAQQGTVLWKPIHPKRIAIYAVGCEHRDSADLLQFRLSVLDKPLLLPASARKIAP